MNNTARNRKARAARQMKSANDAARRDRRSAQATQPRTTFEQSMAEAAARRAARTPEQVAADAKQDAAEAASIDREAARGQAR